MTQKIDEIHEKRSNLAVKILVLMEKEQLLDAPDFMVVLATIETSLLKVTIKGKKLEVVREYLEAHDSTVIKIMKKHGFS